MSFSTICILVPSKHHLFTTLPSKCILVYMVVRPNMPKKDSRYQNDHILVPLSFIPPLVILVFMVLNQNLTFKLGHPMQFFPNVPFSTICILVPSIILSLSTPFIYILVYMILKKNQPTVPKILRPFSTMTPPTQHINRCHIRLEIPEMTTCTPTQTFHTCRQLQLPRFHNYISNLACLSVN